jgi:glycosyltransferase involved in cell wall biosynthesis
MHNTDQDGWMGAQHLFLFKTRAWVVVHSRAARDNLLAGKARPDESRLVIIPMGCPDYRSTFGPREEVRAELDLPADAFVVGFFGFAAPYKNIPNLIKAVQKLPGVMGYIHASVHPTNPWAVDQIYRECGLPRRHPGRNRFDNVVLVHDPLPDERFGRAQNAMDVIVLPYDRHGSSISTSMMAYEALASYRPVLTTDVVYFSELKDEVLKVSRPDPDVLAGAIRYLQENDEVCKRLVAGATRLVEQYSWPRVAERYLEVLSRAGS